MIFALVLLISVSKAADVEELVSENMLVGTWEAEMDEHYRASIELALGQVVPNLGGMAKMTARFLRAESRVGALRDNPIQFEITAPSTSCCRSTNQFRVSTPTYYMLPALTFTSNNGGLVFTNKDVEINLTPISEDL